MSKHLGPIRQLGYVVPDIEAAMKYWSDVLGIGPWYYNPKVPIKNYKYKGESYEPHNSVALANSGYIQVELIQTRNDIPSMYRDFQQTSKSGLQHVAFWTESYDADLEKMIALGWKPVMQGEVGTNGRFIYFDTEYHPGTVIELSEVLGPKGAMFKAIREASENWDGKFEVRPFPDLTTL